MEKQERSKLFKFFKIDSIIENLTGLIEARLELAKLEIKEEVARIGARIIAAVVFAFLGVMIIIFLSMTGATFLNKLLESKWAGYGIVTGLYLLILVLLIVFRAHIALQNKIEDALINNSKIEDEVSGEGEDQE